MIKIELSGSGDEVRGEMLRLLGLSEPNIQTSSLVQKEENKASAVQAEPVKVRRARKGRKLETPPESAWSKDEAEKLLNQIKPNAKNILSELAKKSEGYRKSDLAEALGLKEEVIGGQLSSVGNALRKMPGKNPAIVKERVNGELVYKLDAVVAGVAKQQSG